MAELSPEELLEKQKQNCIFCKIIAGEIPSKKVYEDDDALAILDIRPAAEGHVILLPKQHASILQLLPAPDLLKMFSLTARFAHALREAMLAESVTMFTASGYVAGQQAPHAIIHLIPREKGDGLGMLDLEERNKDQSDIIALEPIFQQAVGQALAHLGRQDALQRGPTPVQQEVQPVQQSVPEGLKEEVEEVEVAEFDNTKEALQMMLSSNPDLKRMLIAQPSLVEDYVKKSPQLSKLFAGVDIHALSRALRVQEEQQKPQSSEKKAATMKDPELFAFIDGNEGLRKWLLEHPEELALNIKQNPRLESFFAGVDILQLSKRYREHVEANDD